MTKKILMWALDGGLAAGLTGPVDVLTVANAVAARHRGDPTPAAFEWEVQSADGRWVRTASGVKIQADARIDVDADADVVFLPGLFVDAAGPALWREVERHRWLLPALRSQLERGTVLAANCTATVLLAEAGVLDGRIATTSWWLGRTFRQRYPAVDLRVEQAVTHDRGVFCSGAATAGMQLALRLVEKFCGRRVASAAARVLLLDGGHGLQAPYSAVEPVGGDAQGDALVERAQRWMQRRVEEPFQLGALANALAVSERTVIRRFKNVLAVTPGRHAQQLKVQEAKRLLERGDLSWDAVCERVGYSDASSFRRLFKREAGVPPGAYQTRFAPRRSVARN